jgi:hypothetical protein
MEEEKMNGEEQNGQGLVGDNLCKLEAFIKATNDGKDNTGQVEAKTICLELGWRDALCRCNKCKVCVHAKSNGK